MIFTVFDTETTGLPSHPLAPLDRQPRIIEFAGIVTDGRDILHTLEFRCNPGVALEEIITKITGLTDADLRDQPDISHFFGELKSFFGKEPMPHVFGEKPKFARVAHNLSFDRNLLDYDLKRRGKTLDDIGFNDALMICTVEQTTPQFGRPMKLQELWSRARGEFTQKHRALDDVMRLHDVCIDYGIYSAFEEQNELL
ncbi:gram-positive type DNA polymerase III alpha subunit [Burkholderia phage BcepF1]|uniref:Gram-positive type DNA polymerase III alpha subunit n=1 Tax=Burkholderia phage BcepF1 TaxID=2886897 RepID=A1YZY0_9CAUD|nr:gram-positive type DNA polymerase III alpha subunit [Burkholderia phage BcepF1]ABL96807.1 gram-positive type DNA polymerase III alpha subunit [Burkholderia phage BcepF1]